MQMVRNSHSPEHNHKATLTDTLLGELWKYAPFPSYGPGNIA